MATASSARVPGKPHGLLKWAYNLPRALYRLHVGWLLGRRFLLLTHRGRRSGRIHQTMLEVARYDPRTRESVVLSAYGDRADWYRNIQVVPALEVRTGRSRYVPEQRLLDADGAYAVLAAYRRRYGPLLGVFLRYIGSGTPAGSRSCERSPNRYTRWGFGLVAPGVMRAIAPAAPSDRECAIEP